MQDKFELLRVRPLAQIKQALIEEAQRMHAEDIAANQAMGKHGATLMPASGGVLTHCNAGALATCGYGTALGVIRAAVEQGKNIHVFADETRPFLQGSRFTAWELMKDGIPTTVISDNMAGAMMKQGKINAIVVGADRIAANGDVANKIGTYTVAVLAREHGIPFYVAAPLSTVDFETAEGSGIPIEQRDRKEVTHIAGKQMVPEGVEYREPRVRCDPREVRDSDRDRKGNCPRPLRQSHCGSWFSAVRVRFESSRCEYAGVAAGDSARAPLNFPTGISVTYRRSNCKEAPPCSHFFSGAFSS